MNFQQKLHGYQSEGLISTGEHMRIIIHIILISEWDFERKVEIVVHFYDGSTKTFYASPKDLFGGDGPYEDDGCNILGNESMNEAPFMNILDSSERVYSDLAFDSPEIDPCQNDQVLLFYPSRLGKAA